MILWVSYRKKSFAIDFIEEYIQFEVKHNLLNFDSLTNRLNLSRVLNCSYYSAKLNLEIHSQPSSITPEGRLLHEHLLDKLVHHSGVFFLLESCAIAVLLLPRGNEKANRHLQLVIKRAFVCHPNHPFLLPFPPLGDSPMKLFSDEFPLGRCEEEFGTDLTCTLGTGGLELLCSLRMQWLVFGELSRKWDSGEVGWNCWIATGTCSGNWKV